MWDMRSAMLSGRAGVWDMLFAVRLACWMSTAPHLLVASRRLFPYLLIASRRVFLYLLLASRNLFPYLLVASRRLFPYLLAVGASFWQHFRAAGGGGYVFCNAFGLLGVAASISDVAANIAEICKHTSFYQSAAASLIFHSELPA